MIKYFLEDSIVESEIIKSYNSAEEILKEIQDDYNTMGDGTQFKLDDILNWIVPIDSKDNESSTFRILKIEV